LQVLAALDALSPAAFDGVLYRVYNPDHGFLVTEGSYRAGGRWNRKAQYGAVYLSLSRETAVQETRRSARKRNRRPRELGRRDCVCIRVRLASVLDLSAPEFYASAGITKEQVLEEAELCLQIADRVRAKGCEGLIAPSATGSGEVLVLYLDRLLPGWRLEELSREESIDLGE
jgi:RES domain-containing protein